MNVIDKAKVAETRQAYKISIANLNLNTDGATDLAEMVALERLSEEPDSNTSLATTDNNHIEEWPDDASSISTSSKGSHNEDDCQSESGLEIAVPSDCIGNFGNVIVKNSSDVQFGNNTYFQGAVTIKQFVYSGVDDKPLCIEDGKTNLAFTPSNCDIDDVLKTDVISNNSDKKFNNAEKDPNSNTISKGKFVFILFGI